MSKYRRQHPDAKPATVERDAKYPEAEVITLTDEMVTSPETQAQVKELQEKLAAADKEIAELKDKYLRALADGENARKRIRQQSEESTRLQKEALLRDLLPVVDNLERAIEASRGGAGDGNIVQGVEMVLRSLLDFLKSHGVAPIHSAGQPFDPQRHEAVEHISSDVHPPNTVVEESHRGYLIGDRVLRPARVTVAKGSSGRNDSEDAVENN